MRQSWPQELGRCFGQAGILRRPIAELAIACLWAAATWRLVAAGLAWAVPAYLVLIFVCVVLMAVDLSVMRLPNHVTYPAFPLVAILLMVARVAVGDLSRMSRAVVVSFLVTSLFCCFTSSTRGALGWETSS